MNELARQAYLTSLGVDTYYPRALLSGARTSPRVVIALPSNTNEDAVGTNQATNDEAIDSGVQNAAVNAAKALFPEFIDSTVNKAQPDSVTPLAKSVNPLKQANIAFSYILVMTNRYLLICNGVPDGLYTDYQQFIGQLLFALDEPLDHVVFERFEWPMIKSNAIDQSEAVARDALNTFIKERVENTTLLLFGNTADYLSLDSIEPSKVHKASTFNVNYVISQDLLEAIENPSLKAVLWQDLLLLGQV